MMLFPIAVGRWPQVAAIMGGAVVPTAPGQFGPGDWSVADAGTSGDITISITALPSDGGSAITDLEYQIDGGSWVSLAGTTTGDYGVSGLTDDVEVDVAIRAVNAIGNGTASATKAVTPTVGDPNFASVVFLSAFNGADGSTSATDDSNSGHTISFRGSAQIDTAESKFGGASLLLDGAGDAVTAPDSADWHFAAGGFTVEAWVRFNALGAADTIACQWSANLLSWTVRRPDSSTEMQFLCSSNGTTAASTVTTSGAGLTTGVWYHICAERDASNNLRIYIDGVMLAKATVTANFANVANVMAIGDESATNRSLNGWIDEVRITKGVARYASDSGFTPPTAAYPRV